MRYSNRERSNKGDRLKGRTPGQVLMDALGVKEIPEIVPTEDALEPLGTAA